MAIQYKFFMIPIKNSSQIENELNKFLRTVKVVTTHREFIAKGDESCYSLIIEYVIDGSEQVAASNTTSKSKTDYRDLLSPEDFTIYARLRAWRKETSEKEAVPAYTIFTNEQLAKIVEQKVCTKEDLQKIDGVGDGRVKRFGKHVTEMMIDSLKQLKENKAKVNNTDEKKG